MSPELKRKIGALIVDDEELARQILRDLLQAHPEIQILAECANGFEAVKAIAEHKPDLMLLDVQMPKLTGFDVLELIEEDVAVIFVTAYDQYAMKAFEVHAVDYLLKPVGQERFEAALARAKDRIGEKTPPAQQLAAAARPPQQFLERLVVRDGTRVTLIPVGSPRRLCGARQPRGKTPEATDHCEHRSRPGPLPLRPHPPILHCQF